MNCRHAPFLAIESFINPFLSFTPLLLPHINKSVKSSYSELISAYLPLNHCIASTHPSLSSEVKNGYFEFIVKSKYLYKILELLNVVILLHSTFHTEKKSWRFWVHKPHRNKMRT